MATTQASIVESRNVFTPCKVDPLLRKEFERRFSLEKYRMEKDSAQAAELRNTNGS